MKQLFVFYDDDYPDNGGVGFAEFPSREAAARFIEDRILRAQKPALKSYRVIEGRELHTTAESVATRVSICG